MESRFLLAADGFAAGTTGGVGGSTVTVTNATDFVAHATSDNPVTIRVQGAIDIGSARIKPNKTILGLGATASLQGSLGLYETSNVIVQNLSLSNPADAGEGDCITIKNNTTKVWVDHCTFGDSTDGQLDITNGSDFITVSHCKFAYTVNGGHNFSMLIGSSDSRTSDAGKLRVTLHNNWWSTLAVERMPSVRFGRVHAYNNYFSSAGNNYCIRSRIDAETLIQNNFFENVKDPYVIYVTSGTTGKIRATGNVFVNTKGSYDDGNDTVFTPSYAYTLKPGADVKSSVIANAGAGKLGTPVAGPAPTNWWKFDATSGTSVSDSAGTVSGSILNAGSNWTAGRTGNALNLNGSNQSVSLGGSLNATKNFTIAGWIRLNRVTGTQGILGKLTDANQKQFQLSVSAGKLNFQYERDGNNWSLSGGTISANVWTHVAVTVDSALRVSLYVNGTSVRTGVAPKETLASTSSAAIGRWAGSYNTSYLSGAIDDLKFFNKALTAAEVAQLL